MTALSRTSAKARSGRCCAPGHRSNMPARHLLRVPYPLGFFAKQIDGRIDDAKAGWKGRGLWVTSGNRTPVHIEAIDAPARRSRRGACDAIKSLGSQFSAPAGSACALTGPACGILSSSYFERSRWVQQGAWAEHTTVIVAASRMFAFGTKRTTMSAFGGKVDIAI